MVRALAAQASDQGSIPSDSCVFFPPLYPAWYHCIIAHNAWYANGVRNKINVISIIKMKI